MGRKYIFQFFLNNFPTIVTILSLYFAILFTLPYFLHYGFFPEGIIFFNTRVIYITIFSAFIFYWLVSFFFSLMFFHISNLSSIKLKETRILGISTNILKRKLTSLILSVLVFVLIFLTNLFPYFIFILIPTFILLMDTLALNFSKEHKYEETDNDNNNKDVGLYFYSLLLSFLLIIPSFIIIILSYKGTNITSLILTILGFIGFFYWTVFFILQFKKYLFIFMFTFVIIAPLLFLWNAPNGYINLLKISYEKLGLRTASANLYLEDSICKLFSIESERRHKEICNHINMIKIETSEKCYYLIKADIIWNGSKFIYILTKKFFNGDRQKVIPIPKSALLNGDIITEYRENSKQK